MASKIISVNSLKTLSNGSSAILSGKNGFSTVIGQIPLLVSSFTSIDSAANVQLNISYIDNLYDQNFSKNVLEVNDGSFLGLKGNDYVTIPVQEKISGNAALGFIGYQPTITSYSVKILNHNLENGWLVFENAISENKELHDYLPDAPFFVSIGQIIDSENFSANTAFIEGSLLKKDLNYNVEGITGSYTVELGVVPNYKDFIILYVDGKEFPFSYVSGSSNVVINLSGSDTLVRTLTTYYTTPAIETGDNISISVGNVYSIANTSYSPTDPSYNVAMTANSVYVITLASNLKANIGGRTAINISSDLIGTVNNVTHTTGNATALYFEGDDTGDNQFVQIPVGSGSVLDMRGDCTLEAWMEANVGSTHTSGNIMRSGIGVDEVFMVAHDAINKRILFEWNDGSYNTAFSDDNSVPLEIKTHIAVVKDDTLISFFVNGIPAGSSNTATTPLGTPAYLNIGASGPSIQQFWGIIDDVRIWNVARTQSEIQANMNRELFGIESGLVGYWRFNEGVGTIAYDSTSSNNDGIITGATWSANTNIVPLANTFTIDYNDNTYGDFNLANNKIYRLESKLSYVNIDLDTNQTIKNVPVGTNMVRARNKNSFGRRSPYVTKTSVIGNLPIQKVESLSVSESLYKDTSQGIIIRLTISFDHILNQEVTDYEISYKLTTGGGDLESFNTVKVSAEGVDLDGKIRYTIHNADRGRVSSINNIIIRVTPLNKKIRGITAEKSQSIIGKSALPLGIENLTGGQSGKNLVFLWTVPSDENGAIIDIDLNEIVVKQAFGDLTLADYSTAWITATDIAIVATPASTLVTPITTYGVYTYLFKTRDTSDNQSNGTAGITLTTIRPLNVDAVAAWSEDDPSTNAIIGILNENSTEYFFPSFSNSSTGGLSEPGSHEVDNANGTSSGWSVIAGLPTDLKATGNAFYQTQVRDIGQLITGTIIATANGTVSLTTTFNDLYSEILSGATDISGTANVLIDTDFGGIGTILGYSNASAATVTYDEDQGTLISGGTTGNVFAIWNLGQFDGDTSNANSYALIAGTINADTIALGETFFANGVSTGGNTLANLTTISSSYILVDMIQFVDLSPSLTFLGPESAVTANIEIRYAQSDPFYANSNVDSTVFESGTVNEGWKPYATVQRSFRWYQSRLILTNYNPEQAFYILDEYRLILDLEDKNYPVDVDIVTSPQQIDYSSQGFYTIPNIELTMLTDGSYAPVVIDKTIEAANVNVYATANSTAVTGVSLNLLARGV